MTKIVTVTLSHDTAEDRILLSLRLEGDRTAKLWLTQRLARALVTALATGMEKAEGIPLPTVRNVMMAQEQAAAVSSIRPAAPVVIADAGDKGRLIREIDVSFAPDRLSLTFQSDLDIRPTITLDRTLARQWLSMLQRQFVAGGWPQDVWPSWMVEGDPANSAATTRH